jgi:hypothetical protein
MFPLDNYYAAFGPRIFSRRQAHFDKTVARYAQCSALRRFRLGRESTMDYDTRNRCEELCALAEVEQDLEKFIEIKRRLVRLLDEKESHLCPSSQLRPPLNSTTSEADQNPFCYNLAAMLDLFRLWCGAMIRTFRSRRSLMPENLALRQQLTILKRKHPRPKLSPLDKLFRGRGLRFWPRWKETLFLVLPETVVRRHRAGFRRCWAMLCKARKRSGVGRRIPKLIRELIFRMVVENPTWGAPRIHGEPLILGLEVSETSIPVG